MKKIPSWKFGDTKEETDSLIKLVIKGKKTATSSLYESYQRKKIPLPKIGDKNFIQDSNEVERCLIVTSKVKIKPFNKITKAFAKKEGEGDRSLAYWRNVHKRFFKKRLKKQNMKWNNNTLIVCEEFKLLKLI